MVIKKINSVNLHYDEYGSINDKTLVFLHGWGQNIAMMEPLAKPFKNDYHIIIVDLPGFGDSSEPDTIWSVFDYADCLNKLFKQLNVDKPILLGHSFGGKIALAYSSKYEVEKLIVFGSPFRKEIQKLSLKTRFLKRVKKLPGMERVASFAKRHIGSTDYKNASNRMREILVNSVNLDITDDVKKIKCPTLIVWGTNDQAVNIKEAYELEKLISNAGVVEYPGCSHYAYLENINQTINVLNSFWRE